MQVARHAFGRAGGDDAARQLDVDAAEVRTVRIAAARMENADEIDHGGVPGHEAPQCRVVAQVDLESIRAALGSGK